MVSRSVLANSFKRSRSGASGGGAAYKPSASRRTKPSATKAESQTVAVSALASGRKNSPRT